MLPQDGIEAPEAAMRGIQVPHEIGIDQRTYERGGTEDELRER